jgi:hypothetical protein
MPADDPIRTLEAPRQRAGFWSRLGGIQTNPIDPVVGIQPAVAMAATSLRFSEELQDPASQP